MADAAPRSGEYFEGKLWFTRRGSVVTIGMTSAGVEQVGTIENIEFPDEGGDFDKGEVVITVDGTHGNLEITCPAAGLVQEINASAKDDPEVVTEDPLEEGWLVKLEIQDSSDLKEYAADEDEDD